jgi:hypothetical protein
MRGDEVGDRDAALPLIADREVGGIAILNGLCGQTWRRLNHLELWHRG